MNNQLVTYKPKTSLSYVVQTDPAAMAERLALLIVNGKKLLPEERLALAQYSVTTGLNPFVGECYYLPGVGPGPGIAGWRVKAQDQLDWEAQKANIPLARFWCEYVEPAEGEGNFDKAKDLAVKAILHDSLSKTEWEKRTLGHYVEIVKAGLKEGAWEIAKELAGTEPTWTAIGVVRGGENFGPTEKMDRYERACKRAEKAAIRKRFQRVYLPEPVGFNPEDVIDAQVREVPTEAPKTETEITSELGYTPEPEKASAPQQPTPAQPTINNGIPRPYKPEIVKEKLEAAAAHPKLNTYKATDKQRDLLRYALELAFAGDDAVEDKRHTVSRYLTGKESTKDIPGPLVKTMIDLWLKPVKDTGGEFQIDPLAVKECQAIYAESLKAQGQMSLPVEQPVDDSDIPEEFR